MDGKTLAFRYSLLSNLVGVNRTSNPISMPNPHFFIGFLETECLGSEIFMKICYYMKIGSSTT